MSIRSRWRRNRRQSRLVRRARRRRSGRVYRGRRGEGRHDVYPASSVAGGGFSVRRRRVLCDHIAGRGYAMKRRCRARRRAPFALVLGGWVGVVRICIPLDLLAAARSTAPSTALPLPSSPALPLLTFGGAAPPAPSYTTFPACTSSSYAIHQFCHK